MSSNATSDDRRRIYSGWTAERLVRAAFLEADQYDSSAVAVMRAELEARGLSASDIAALREDMRLHRDHESRLAGVRGWLLLFVIMVGASSAGGFALGAALTLSGEGWLARGQGLVTLALGIYGACCAWLLGYGRPAAPVHARRWLILLAVNGLAVAGIGLAVRGELPDGVGRPLLFAMIWLPYLARSRRVARVYGSAMPSAPRQAP